MIFKIGLLGGPTNAEIVETHWFHTGLNIVAWAASPDEMKVAQATPFININSPQHMKNQHNEALKRWASHDWAQRLAILPPGLNPFMQLSDGKDGASILVPSK